MSANIDSAYFLSLFDEFSRENIKKVEAFIDIASGRVPLKVWGDNTKYATALLTAHMLSSSGRKGVGHAGGAVSQEAVGDLSRSYAQVFDVNSGDAALMTTRYGIDFVALRSETIVSMTTVGSRFPFPRRC